MNLINITKQLFQNVTKHNEIKSIVTLCNDDIAYCHLYVLLIFNYFLFLQNIKYTSVQYTCAE